MRFQSPHSSQIVSHNEVKCVLSTLSAQFLKHFKTFRCTDLTLSWLDLSEMMSALCPLFLLCPQCPLSPLSYQSPVTHPPASGACLFTRYLKFESICQSHVLRKIIFYLSWHFFAFYIIENVLQTNLPTKGFALSLRYKSWHLNNPPSYQLKITTFDLENSSLRK